jgi:hypothetical protein
VDEQGREVRAPGAPPPAAAATAAGPGPAGAAAAAAAPPDSDDRFFDPTIGNRALRRLERRPRASLQFVEEGRFQKQAETARLRVRAERAVFMCCPGGWHATLCAVPPVAVVCGDV